MSYRELYFVLAILIAVLIVQVSSDVKTNDKDITNLSVKRISELFDPSKIKDHYPLAWVEIPYKPVIDNTRLFKKYKSCMLSEKQSGCPKLIKEILKLVPEAIASNCAKCLPAHIKEIKEIAEYVCHTRREDFEEIRRIRDPHGAIQTRFENKYGKINC